MIRAAAMLVAILGISLISCSSETARRQDLGSQQSSETALQDGSGQFPTSLPQDGVQPWEELDSDGLVIPAVRSASSINLNTDFTPGVERFLDSGDAADNLEATRLNGISPTGTSSAMYRVTMGAQQPGIVSVDANLLSGKGYYVGLSNYGTGRWDWQGPFTDNHVRLQAVTDSSADLTSALGNTFISVLCPAGTSADVVGIGVNQYDPASATAPATPLGLTASPIPGGLELNWSPVLDPDLAGYAIYHANRSFINPHSAGVQRVAYLEGSTRHLLGGLTDITYLRIASVDFSGNESAVSPLVQAVPLPGNSPLQLVSTAPSGMLNDVISLTATGAASFDWDLDGDGVFEIQNDNSGSQSAITSSLGIIRPRVVGRDAEGQLTALGGVSLVITGNTRPVASAIATPQSGIVPLDVTFTGSADDNEDAPEALTFAWDFDGDGIYEADTDSLNPAQQNYSSPGLYNAKFRVTDSGGAWDVDTVALSATAAPLNLPPHAAFSVEGGKRQPAPFIAEFDLSGCSDPDGSIVLYEWDWDNDGSFDFSTGAAAGASHLYPEIGEYTVRLRVTDDGGAGSEAVIRLVAQGWKRVTIDTGNTAGQNLTFSVIGEHPAIVYYNSASDSMEYVRSSTPTGEDPADWSGIVDLDGASGAGVFGMSLAEVQGTPAVAYQRASTSDLYYIRSQTATGSLAGDWGTPVLVESGPARGYYAEMLVVAGRPAICYYDLAQSSLRYVRSTSDTGAAAGDWLGDITIDNSADVGTNPSMAIIDGNPAISHFDDTSNRLLYIRSTSASGTLAGDWSQQVILTGGSGRGYYSKLVELDGRPAVCYNDPVSNSLAFRSSTTPSGSLAADWLPAFDIDSFGSAGDYAGMVVHNGRPACCSKAGSNSSLRFVEASGLGSQPLDWLPAQTVDELGDSGNFAAIIEVQGKLAVAYIDNDIGRPKYAIRYE
ncbi:MAG: PKD domain-containing protein [bacterium]